jgi:hypothetical protein
LLRAGPKRTLFGLFFDVPNLMRVALRETERANCRWVPRQSSREVRFPVNDGGWNALPVR